MISKWFVHTGTVQTFEGTSGYGVDTFADPVTRPGFLDGSVKLVRDKDGQQVTATASWFTSKDDLALYTPDSLVSVNNVVNRRVINVNYHDSGNLGLPDHLEVYLA